MEVNDTIIWNRLKGEVPMREKTKKATFNLHPTVLAALDQAVTQGMASSKNVLVEQALLRELKELRRQRRKAQWEEAARDPLFLKDIEEIETAFMSADAETARGIH